MTRRWLYIATPLYALLVASLWLPTPEAMATGDAMFKGAVAICGVALARYWWQFFRGEL
ncbi:MAG: hypothetical protein AAFY65_16510 [Pseudomonadota bacterium]